MYKLKYYSLSKEEKKDLIKKFKETNQGKDLYNRFKRLIVIGTLGLLFSIFMFITYKNNWDLVTATTLLIFSLIFIISPFIIRINKLNDYLVKTGKNN